MNKLLSSNNQHIITKSNITFSVNEKPNIGFSFDGLFYDESSKTFLKYIDNIRYTLNHEEILSIIQFIEKINIPTQSVTDLKLIWNKKVNELRAIANQTSFTFMSKEIAVDRLSRSDLDGISSYISLYGELPPGFPKVWKTLDNSYIPIPDINTFKLLIAAMVAQGSINFYKSEQLKQKIKYATYEQMQDDKFLATIVW